MGEGLKVVLTRGAGLMAERRTAAFVESTSLRVYVCGSASPLGMGQAQACIAVATPEHFYLIESGAGSTDNINRLGLPTERLQGLFLTHFHSDHIAEIYEVNLGSWVRGRPAPLTVYGPRGVDEVINAVNAGYRLDRIYRTGHHGEDLLLHDALSLPTVTALSEAMGTAGQPRQSKIVADVMDYHASTDSLIELSEKSNVV